jgi:hypothetical protein
MLEPSVLRKSAGNKFDRTALETRDAAEESAWRDDDDQCSASGAAQVAKLKKELRE